MENLKNNIKIYLLELAKKVGVAIKEFLRLALLAAVAYLATDGVEILVSMLGVKFQLDQQTKLLIAGLLTTILKSIDRQLHSNAKDQPANEQNTGLLGLKGLTGF